MLLRLLRSTFVKAKLVTWRFWARQDTGTADRI